MINVDAVTLAYPLAPNRYVLNAMHLQIPKGARIALKGRSGSGKSTLAKIVAGHLCPQSGKVLFNNRDMTGRPGKHALLVHQDSDLFPWQSAEQHLWMALGRKDKMTSERLLDLVGLSDFAAYYPNQLSGGMQKRLALARGVALSPDLMILDETFSSLDKTTKDHLMNDLQALWRDIKTTLLLITHDPTEMARIATDVIEMPHEKEA